MSNYPALIGNGTIKIPMGRQLVRAIVRHGMSQDYPDNEKWLLAKGLESMIRTRFYKENLALSGPPVQMDFSSESAVALLSKRLNEIDGLIGSSLPWKEKKQWDIFISGTGKVDLNIKTELSVEIKEKAERIVEIMVNRCARLYREIMPFITDKWLPDVLCDWSTLEKGSGMEQSNELVRINLKSLISDEETVRNPYYTDDSVEKSDEEVAGFYSLRWEAHVIAAVCYAMSQAMKIECNKSGLNNSCSNELPELYRTTRSRIVNPLLQEMGVSIAANQGKISMVVPSLT